VYAETFLNSLIDYEKIPGYHYDLSAFRRFLETAGIAYKKLHNVIHIAGTKGKGSVAAMINACLVACGYRVGSFTSPHLTRLNERIQIDGKEISDRQLSSLVQKLAPILKRGRSARTFFEAVTAIAFHHFNTHRTDFTVLEVGLGGRLDATNITEPRISVITRIGYDHTHLLGHTLPAIAGEKAGILKPGGVLVTSKQRYSVRRVINAAARACRNTVIAADQQHCITVRQYSFDGMRVQVSGKLGTFTAFLPLVGQHQIENLSITLAVLAELKDQGFSMPTPGIVRGLRHTLLRGRFEVLSERPRVIFDCAHNEDSFRALHQNIKLLGIRSFFLIFGSNMHKDIRYCVTRMFPEAQEVVLVKPQSPRAMEPYVIRTASRPWQKRISIASSVDTALDYLKKRGRGSIPVIITGSFYLWQRNWSTR
jgi:dihydrofolate synthase/folylpolyglutamate synthase